MIGKFAAMAMAFLTLFSLSGCKSGQDSDILEYDLTAAPASLDPQFATDQISQMIIGNVFESLLVQGESGELAPGVAYEYTLSQDHLTYTFLLRQDACWSNGDPVTAQDFAFAFKRIFNHQVPSPYASNLLCISGGEQVLAGEASEDTLGIKAIDNYTLEIQLAHPNPDFPLLLTSTYTMPCQEKFFSEQKGRYGVDAKTTLYNGPFVISSYDKTKSIKIRANSNYVSEQPVVAGGVNFYLGRENPLEQFLDGNADAICLTYENLEQVKEIGAVYEEYENTTWALVFCQDGTDFAQEDIRKALVSVIQREDIAQMLSGDAVATVNFIPPEVLSVSDSYRQVVGDNQVVQVENPREVFNNGLSQLEKNKLDPSELLIVDTAMSRKIAGSLQQSWQKELNAYINVQPLEQQELMKRVESGNFQIALVPFTPTYGRADSMLTDFMTQAEGNFCGYANEVYDNLVLQGTRANDSGTAARYFYQAENQLISSATVTPLYHTSTYYAMAPGVSGIYFSPFQGGVYFKYAKSD